MEKQVNKDLSIEIMRIISAFFVIFNHGAGFVVYQQYETGSLKFYTYLFVSVFCKFAVPLFFMISGALLLGKEESIKAVFKKRVCKIVLVLIGITMIYYIAALVFGEVEFRGWYNIGDFLGKLLSGQVISHLWFMYSYIVFLLVLPFFRVMIKAMNKNMINYFCLLAIIFNCVVPVAQYLMFRGQYEMYVSFSLFTMKNIAAPFIGYWLYTYLDYNKVKTKHIVILWMINILSIVITCLMTHMTIKDIGTNSGYGAERFFYDYATLNAATILVTIKKYYKPCKKERINNIISVAGGATFGIFLFHFLLFRLNWFNYIAVLSTNIGFPMIGWFAATGIYFTINLIFVLIIKKIPCVNKYI